MHPFTTIGTHIKNDWAGPRERSKKITDRAQHLKLTGFAQCQRFGMVAKLELLHSKRNHVARIR